MLRLQSILVFDKAPVISSDNLFTMSHIAGKPEGLRIQN